MPDSGVYLFVVGQNTDARCDIANALLRQRNIFRSFSTRKKVSVRSRTTVNGKNLNIITAPDLSTPAWTHLTSELKQSTKFKTRVFLYVRDNDCIDSDDDGWIKILKTKFAGKGKTDRVVCVKYNTIFRRDDSNTPSVLDDSFREFPEDDRVIFCKRDSLDVKTEKADKIIKSIMKSIDKTSVKFKGAMSVDDRKGKARPSMGEPSTSQDSETETENDILESVAINDEFGFSGDDELRSMDLPYLNDEDWVLYRKTLKHGRARSNHVRVNVVGNQGAGKTSLVSRLQGVDIQCPDPKQRPTEGLKINQVTTRCVERNGERYWETKSDGYEQELNLQRMAFALQYAQDVCSKESKEEVSKTEGETPTVNLAELLELGSDEVVEEELQSECRYGELIDSKLKEKYLQKVKRWVEIGREERMYVSYWDFAGQTTYYSTHQAFMAPSAVYVLVIDLSIDLDTQLKDRLTFRTTTSTLKEYTVEETIKFWISSIKAYTRDEQNGHAPFIVVGTHQDKVKKEEIKRKFGYLRQVLKNLTQVEFVAIDNTCKVKSDSNLRALRNKILDLGLGVIDEEIPAQWINLEYTVLQNKSAGKSVLKLEEIQQFDAKSDMPMKDTKQIEAFLEHEHRRGWLMHFCHAGLKDIVILDPDFLANYFNVLLRPTPDHTFRSSGRSKDGLAHKDFIFEAAAHAFNIPETDETVTTITQILTSLHIMHSFEDDQFFIPCLLPHQKDKESFKVSLHKEKAPILKLTFADAFVPPAFYHLLVAALIEEPSLTIYKKSDKPRIFNLFACFCFQRETLWLEVHWHECCVYFELINYSSEKMINETGSNKLKEVIEIIQTKIDHILKVYRQNNVRYMLDIQCTKHKKVSTDTKEVAFVNLHKVREQGEVMCTDGDETHVVSWNEISQALPLSPCSEDNSVEMRLDPPRDRHFGRLARHLSMENALSLASKLELQNHEAVVAMSDWEGRTDMQRLKLLRKWKEIYPECSIGTLLKILSKQNNYDIRNLQNIVDDEICLKDSFGLDPRLLDSGWPGNQDLRVASDYIGSSYAFLMIELGLTYRDIEIKRVDNPHSLRERIYQLLIAWRQQYVDQATPRKLLNTLKYLGLEETSSIVSKFNEEKDRVLGDR